MTTIFIRNVDEATAREFAVLQAENGFKNHAKTLVFLLSDHASKIEVKI